LSIKAEIRKIVRESGAQLVPAIIQRLNPVLAGWVRYFRVANSNRAFGEVRDYVEMKVRTLQPGAYAYSPPYRILPIPQSSQRGVH
jgi:hypothetical protein